MVRKGDITIAFKAISLSDLSNCHKRVAAAVLDHFNRQSGRCDPSMETLALLLRISRRTVVRAMNRLVREGYFERDKNGGNFHCNQYYPGWKKFREVDAAWDAQRRMHRERFARTKMSLPSCQMSPLSGDEDVTQTCPINNQSYETYRNGLPKKQLRETAASTMELIAEGAQAPARQLHVKQSKSGDVARSAAERRWNSALTRHYSHSPEIYSQIIAVIDQPLSEAATDAEMKYQGAGIEHILAELRRRDLRLEHAGYDASAGGLQ